MTYNGSSYDNKEFAVSTEWTIVSRIARIGDTSFYIYNMNDVAGDWLEIDWIWIGDYSYLTGSLSEEAARISNELGDTAGVGSKAYSTLTSDGTNIAASGAITVGGKAYNPKATAVELVAEGDFLIGATAGETLDNFKSAFNADAGTKGTTHFCAVANALATATDNAATTQKIEAAAVGKDYNQVTTACTITHLSWVNPAGGATTLSGGKDAVGEKIKTQLNAAIGAGAAVGARINRTSTSIIGYFNTVDCASGAQVTLPAGGTWAWEVMTYGATYNSVKSGTAAGGAAITGTASANLCMRYERIA